MDLCRMFSSSFEGERANAALMADKLVRAVGDWPDVICDPATISTISTAPTLQAQIARCLKWSASELPGKH